MNTESQLCALSNSWQLHVPILEANIQHCGEMRLNLMLCLDTDGYIYTCIYMYTFELKQSLVNKAKYLEGHFILASLNNHRNSYRYLLSNNLYAMLIGKWNIPFF